MKITALDIRQKTFEKSFRGVDKDEVQAFLTTVSQHWERMSDENRELRLKLEHAQHDVQKMREVESSLYRTLKTAEDTSTSITEQAQRDADLRVREAQFQAEQLVNEARQRARSIVDEAYQQAEKAVADMQREVGGLGQECQRLEQHLDSLVRDLHNLASDALEKVEKARARPNGGTAAILSRAASVKVERPKEPAPEIAEPMPTLTAPAPLRAVTAPVAVPTPLPEAPLRAVPAAETVVAEPAPSTQKLEAPAAYNPKPGQQPDPGAPAQAPGPEIERPAAPAENPGISPAPHIDQPEPSQVPEPPAPYVQPAAPDIQPVTPSYPEINQPSPVTHPGQPGMDAAAEAPAAKVAEPVASAEKSFFDEI